MPNDSNDKTRNTTVVPDSQTGSANTTGAPNEPTIAEAAASVATSRNYKDYYNKWKPRWMLIPADEAMRVTVDVSYVMQCIYGLLPEVEKIRSDIYRECPNLSPTLIEDLAEATGGLGHCETLKRGAAGGGADHANNPVQVARGIRTALVFHGGPLIAQGKLTPEDLTLSQGNSPRDIAFDVMKFVAKISDNYEFIEGKSLLTRADLQAATRAAEDLLQFLGVREKAQANAEETTLMRQRALTQVYELYEELRAGVHFTRRRQKDGDVITPSLFTMRTKKSVRDAEEASTAGASAGTTAASAPGSEASAAAGGIDLAQLQALMSGNGAPSPNTVAPLPSTSGSNPTTTTIPGGAR
jgi:hypothetical protein